MDIKDILLQAATLKDPLAALAMLGRHYPGLVAFSSSLGQEDQVLTDMICKKNLDIEIFTLDTGRLFQDTYDLLDKTRARYRRTIRAYFPDTHTVEEFVSKKGPNSFYDSVENRKECCFIRKVEPLQRALRGKLVWITGIRAEQSPNREQMKMLEWDVANGIYKFHPLLHWTLEEVQEYLDVHSVPYNSLHDKGFPSIGCAPCTRVVAPGEDVRAGRWWWESSQKECGLHSHQEQNKSIINAE